MRPSPSIAAAPGFSFMLGITVDNPGAILRPDVPVCRHVIDAELHEGPIGRELLAEAG
jgi:hypothetical protein